MQLIGMLDSPYVRRVAVSLLALKLPFEHRSVSVFRGFEAFAAVNPVVKAPTLVCDDGTVLMDSTLILDYAERLASPASLMPADLPAARQALRRLGLALAGTEKSVQIVYEHGVRPAEKRHQPWLDRVVGQMQAAFGALDADLAATPAWAPGAPLTQDAITCGVAWTFARALTPEPLPEERYPRLAALTAALEQTPEFRAAPHGDGTVVPLR